MNSVTQLIFSIFFGVQTCACTREMKMERLPGMQHNHVFLAFGTNKEPGHNVHSHKQDPRKDIKFHVLSKSWTQPQFKLSPN